jgi:hypothetical protein
MVGFPLLLIPIAIYNIIAFLMPGVSFSDTLVTVPLMSGAGWTLTPSDVLLGLGIVLVLLEVIKAGRPGAKYLTDHLLSLIVFGGAVAEFLLWPKFGNSTYFLLCLLAMTDFFAGIALRTRRAVYAGEGAATSRRAARKADRIPVEPARPEPEAPQPVPEPKLSAAPAEQAAPVETPHMPAAAATAESVLLDRPEPRPAAPVAAESEPAGGVAAPDLQPNRNS